MRISSLTLHAATAITLLLATGCNAVENVENTQSMPAQSSALSFDVTKYGAVGDGKTLNTERIQSAINRLAAQGGGTLRIPQGVFVTSSLFFKPGVNLHLEKDAVLKSTTDQSLFPKQRTRIEGHFQNNYQPALINADGCDGFQLTGEGTLDGAGWPIWEMFWKQFRAAEANKTEFNHYLIPRLRLALIENSKNVVIDGVTFKDSQFWNLHLYNCRDVVVKNARFVVPDDYHQAPSSDGVDVDSSQNVKIQNCYFSVTDDCVCLKGNRYDGIDQEPKSPPVENVLVEDCTFVRGHGALVLGTEAITIRDVEMKNCVVRGKMPMLRLKVRRDTPNQNYSNVRVHDIKLEGTQGEIVYVSPYHGTNARKKPEKLTSKISNVTIENISGSFGKFGSLSGVTTATVSDFTLRNIDVTVAGDPELKTKGVSNVKLENVAVHQAP